ncbi:hypothetical protein PTKIN_Ptkin05aG0151200 [Pterospermum kingtungense]
MQLQLKKGKSVVIEEIVSVEEESSSSAEKLSNGEIVSMSSANDEKNKAKKDAKEWHQGRARVIMKKKLHLPQKRPRSCPQEDSRAYERAGLNQRKCSQSFTDTFLVTIMLQATPLLSSKTDMENPVYWAIQLISDCLFNASNGLVNGANSMHKYRQQIQERPNVYNAGSSSLFQFGSPILHSSNSTLATGKIGTISGYPTLDSSCTNNNSNAGFRLTTDAQLIGVDQTRLNVGNENMNIAGIRNQTFCYMAHGGSPSAGLA